MARISSRKSERSRNGRSAHIVDNATFCEPYGIVFSGRTLIVNLTDGERTFTVRFDETETARLRDRLCAASALAA